MVEVSGRLSTGADGSTTTSRPDHVEHSRAIPPRSPLKLTFQARWMTVDTTTGNASAATPWFPMSMATGVYFDVTAPYGRLRQLTSALADGQPLYLSTVQPMDRP